MALVADVMKMYRDLHHFIWRRSRDEALKDFRMKHVTFGVSASCFAANMAVKQNAEELKEEFPLAYQAVRDSFYVDDGLTGANDIQTAVLLRQQLQEMFSRAGFQLKKWNSNEPSVLCQTFLKETVAISGQFTKTLGIEWDITMDSFHASVSQFHPEDGLT